MDIPCPKCSQPNESERDVCWACFQVLRPKEAPPATKDVANGFPDPPPEQARFGPFNVARTTRTRIKINGREYASLEDVPEQFRSLIQDSLQRAGQGQKGRIVVNGREYASVDEVPEPFRSKLAENIARSRADDVAAGPSGDSAFRIGPFTLRSHGRYVRERLDSQVAAAPPGGFSFEENGQERRITWRWLSWSSFAGIFFAVVFGIPFAFVFYIYMHSPPGSWPPSALAMLIFLGTPPAGLLYVWLGYLVNRTTLRVDAARLSVRHGPLPWLGARDVLKSEIASAFSEQVTYASSSTSDGTAFEPKVTYAVSLLLKSGRTLGLVSGLLAPEQAVFIEQQVRRP